ncbi:MAG: exopolysaccharide biosynthesis polyprenyl glycosylphosphotransferase [Candidatus Gastranaerophilaceae bacterium]|jgi:exopolysaccharide biosynthesis polyprenyl glycosylphosphotransferase
MTKLSKSVYWLLFIDISIFISSTYFIASFYNISKELTLLTAILYSLSGVYVLFLKGYYKIRKYEFFLKDAYLLFEGLVLASVIPYVILLFLFFDKSIFNFFLKDVGCIYVLMLIWRFAFYTYRHYFQKEKNILIIGAGNQGEKISKEILARPELKLNITGFIDNDENKLNTELNGIAVIGKTLELKEIIEKNDIKIVVVAISAKLEHQVLMDISECIPQDIDIYKMPYLYEKITQKVPVKIINPDWFMYEFTSLERPLYGFLKRLFDVAAAIIILMITFPVLLIIGIIVKLYDGGNAMYFQDRVGKNGKLFKLYKLRTMCQNADKEGMVDKGNTSDDRVIPFCKWVRKARFDEIPQMINVLKGEMSIVGPRAEFVDFVRKYEKEIPFYNRRHWITPGWTGWAQINQGHCVNVDDIIEKLRYDFFYIKHRNIFWDFSILMKAVAMALGGRHG